jgi:predicted phage terminase large subunit-like protein
LRNPTATPAVPLATKRSQVAAARSESLACSCRAATEKRSDNDPDATVAVLLSQDQSGCYYVEHVLKMFASPHTVEQSMKRCAEADGPETIVAYMQDPGSAGVAEAQATARALDGSNVRFAVATGDKEVRAKPISAQAEAGNVKLVRGLWNDEFLRELENFPAGKHDDAVDALSGAYSLVGGRGGKFEYERVNISRPGSSLGYFDRRFLRDKALLY